MTPTEVIVLLCMGVLGLITVVMVMHEARQSRREIERMQSENDARLAMLAERQRRAK